MAGGRVVASTSETAVQPGKIAVSDGAHSIGEQATGNANLSDYAISISCKDRGGRGATVAQGQTANVSGVNVSAGADVVCTVTNVRVPPECLADAPFNVVVGSAFLNGTDGNDLIVSRGGSSYIQAGAGNDCILGGDGNDIINAGPGKDKVWSGAGNDIVQGGDGDDMVNAGDGRDIVIGGPGVDQCQGEVVSGCEDLP